jgi:hypothetical protein
MTAIVMINNSGNTGKSTSADNLIAPRLTDAKIVRIETINTHDGDADENMTGKQYGDLVDGAALFDNIVVDVGSSNIEVFLRLMNQYKGSHNMWDYFVVPVVPSNKQIKDTIATIESLSASGISPDKIRLLFNKVESADSDLEKVFAPLFAYHQAENKFILNKDAVIYEHEFFTRTREQGKTIKDILDDDTDYNSLIKNAETPEEKIKYSRMRGNIWLAKELNEQLDKAFAALTE